MTCHIIEAFGFGTRKVHRENWLQTFSNFLFLFWTYGSKFIYRYRKQEYLFYLRSNNVFSTVQFTVPAFSFSNCNGKFEASKTLIGGVAINGPLGFEQVLT